MESAEVLRERLDTLRRSLAFQNYEKTREHVLRMKDLERDRAHTMAEDMNAYVPLARLTEAAAAGRLGALAPRFHGAPTNRSQRVTMEQDCPELLQRCQEDAVDAAVLVAN